MPDPDWHAAVANALPAGAALTALPQAERTDAALRAAAVAFPGENLVLVRAGTALPPFWSERLVAALALPDALVAAPLDNVDPARAPLPPGALSVENAATIDPLCYAYSRREALRWPTFSTLLSAWNGPALRAVASERISGNSVPEDFAARAYLLDHLYVAAPAQELRGPALPAPEQDAAPPSALGE